MPRRKEPRIPDSVLDQLLAGADPKTVFDPNGLIDDLKKALAERVLNAEMDHHLAGEEQGNRRNGYGKKTVITDIGHIELEVPRDRQARFDPQLIAKYQRRFAGFDDKIISMYARGMSARDRRSFARSLRHRGFAGFDQRGHRRGAGGGFPLASPPVGSSLSADFLRRAAGQDPRRRAGSQQSCAYRAGRARRWHQGNPRPLARGAVVGFGSWSVNLKLRIFSPVYRVAGGGRPPPVPTGRSVQIS